MRLNQIHKKQTIVHKTLNPKLWHNNQLDPIVAKKLLTIAYEFKTYLNVYLNLKDVIVTGSNANYNWTSHSDIDVHLLIPNYPTPTESELYQTKKKLWSLEHTIIIKNIPVELYVQSQYDTLYATGVYSLFSNSWLKYPSKSLPPSNDIAVQSKFNDLKQNIIQTIHDNNLQSALTLKDKLHNMRQAGLEKGGEYSVENITYKKLRNKNLIDKLSQHILSLQDTSLSLESHKPTL